MEKYIKQKDLASYREDNKPISCPVLGNLEFSAVVDHDHRTGRIRGVISLEGNALLGKIENFFNSRCSNSEKELPEVLRKIADYLECSQGPYHPVGLRQITKRMKRSTVSTQLDLLRTAGASAAEIESCKNSTQRVKLYRSLITGKE